MSLKHYAKMLCFHTIHHLFNHVKHISQSTIEFLNQYTFIRIRCSHICIIIIRITYALDVTLHRRGQPLSLAAFSLTSMHASRLDFFFCYGYVGPDARHHLATICILVHTGPTDAMTLHCRTEHTHVHTWMKLAKNIITFEYSSSLRSCRSACRSRSKSCRSSSHCWNCDELQNLPAIALVFFE